MEILSSRIKVLVSGVLTSAVCLWMQPTTSSTISSACNVTLLAAVHRSRVGVHALLGEGMQIDSLCHIPDQLLVQ